jgi:hypothetical protein
MHIAQAGFSKIHANTRSICNHVAPGFDVRGAKLLERSADIKYGPGVPSFAISAVVVLIRM